MVVHIVLIQFNQMPTDHLKGAGCPKCCKKQHSKQQIEWLEYIAKRDNINIQHAMNDKEFKVGKYRVDGYCKETNTVYEFNGIFYHGHPKFFKPLKLNSVCKKTYGELYIATLEKQLFIENQGYNLVTIWEHEWKALKQTL